MSDFRGKSSFLGAFLNHGVRGGKTSVDGGQGTQEVKSGCLHGQKKE